MKEILVGIFTILIGLSFSVIGYKLMRVLFPIWGLITGFWLGAGLVNLITDDGFISTTFGIVAGIVFAVLGAAIAYLYYSVAVLLFMGGVGFWLGAGLATLFDFEIGVLSAIVGVVFALVFVAVGIVINAPKGFLIFITSFAGSAAAIAGLLLVIGTADIEEFEHGSVHVALSHGTLWSLLVVTGGIIGLVIQTSTVQDDIHGPGDWKKADVSA